MNVQSFIEKLRRLADDRYPLSIGEAWNALDEAADVIEELVVRVSSAESFDAEIDSLLGDTEEKADE